MGDATAIGYLRHIDPGRSLAWWAGGVPFAGCQARLVACYEVFAEGKGSRLVSRMSADAEGASASLALWVFRVIDSIMASRQLVGLRDRVEYCEKNRAPRDPETGDRGQYQLYEILYAAGGSAGVKGREHGEKWRRTAIKDGVLEEGDQ